MFTKLDRKKILLFAAANIPSNFTCNMMNRLFFCKHQFSITRAFAALAMLTALSFSAKSQSYWLNTNHQFNQAEKLMYQPGTNLHTSIKNYEMRQTQAVFDFDSVHYSQINIWEGKQNVFRRFINADLFKWDEKDDYTIAVNPLFNLEAGKEQVDGKGTLVNTRGIMINGTIGKCMAFYADFYENQGSFPNYIQQMALSKEIIPGQGKAKPQNYDPNASTFDYSSATGYVSIDAGKHFNFQLGNGKNFIGDGYRSMLMSDLAFNYPFFKINTTFGKVKYMVMWTSMTHFTLDNANDDRYPIKYGAFHYLDWNIGKRLSLGLFEAVTWADIAANGEKRGFDWHYANPLVFFRPVEYNIGSPDNMTLGLNSKYVAAKWLTLYGQLVLDEFKLDEMTSGDGWWANKFGYQLGVKTFDLFGIRNLRLQAEYNQARPYLYSHSQPTENYGHYNQPIAHPLGANFRETLGILNYQYKRWFVRLEGMMAKYGADDSEDVSYGHDIFKSNNLRPNDYGNTMMQGIATNLTMVDASLSYLINPRNNFNLTFGYRMRTETSDLSTLDTKFVYAGIRTSLRNLYYDF
jgi:hypothetical protein